MKETKIKELEEIFQNYVGEHGDFLHLIAVYGSATRKTDVEGSDIDVLVLIDSSMDITKGRFDRIKRDLKQVEEENPEYNIHTQPPKTLKKWWELTLESEPWVLTSIEDIQAIYDPEGLSETLNSFPSQRYMEDDYKSREMFEKGLDNLEDIREEVINKTAEKLEENVFDAAKSIFSFQGKKVLEEDIEERIREDLVEHRQLMSQKDVDNFSKVQEYSADTISFVEFEEVFDSGLKFIDKTSETIRELEILRREKIVENSFDEVFEISRNVLNKENTNAGLIEEFRKTFIEEGDISEEYDQLLEDVLAFKKKKEKGNLEEIKGERIYSASAKVSDFKNAVENLSAYTEVENENLKEQESGDNRRSQYSKLQNFQGKINEKFGDAVKASWILSIDEILETEDFTIKILVDTQKVKVEEVDSFLEDLSKNSDNQSYRIHPEVLSLQNYWRKLKAGDQRLFSELRYATTLYDPEKIFLPIKEMVEEGKLEGTREAIQKQISSSIESTLLLRDRYKVQAVNKTYNVAVTMGQAMLVSRGYPVPVQKKVPEKIKEELVSNGDLAKEVYENVRYNIRYWKDYEHGEFNDISARDLDQLHKNAENIAEKAKNFI